MTDGLNEIFSLMIISVWSLIVVMMAFDSLASQIAAFLLLDGIVYFLVRMVNPSFEKVCNTVKQQYFDRFLEAHFKTHGLSLDAAHPST